jgi:hypothetical protein
MAECWQELAAAASREKDSEKFRLLIARLIDTLGHEQKQLRGEIEKRLAHSAEATDARFRPFHPVALLEYTQRLLRHKTRLLRSARDDGRLFLTRASAQWVHPPLTFRLARQLRVDPSYDAGSRMASVTQRRSCEHWS